jgi:hypothetical protein
MSKLTHYTGSSTLNFTSTSTVKPLHNEGIFFSSQRVLLGKFNLSSQASGTKLIIGTVPNGSYILDIRVYHAALGGSVTLKVGDDDDDDRFVTAASASGAGLLSIANDQIGYYVDPSSFSNNKDIIIEIGGAAATGAVNAYCYWSHPDPSVILASAPGAAS